MWKTICDYGAVLRNIHLSILSCWFAESSFWARVYVDGIELCLKAEVGQGEAGKEVRE